MMLDALKYLPISWRSKKEYCAPGPQYKNRRSVKFLAGGNVVFLDLPPHRPSDRSVYPGETPRLYEDQLDRSFLPYSQDTMANQDWQNVPVLSRRWAFWGPWMTGHKGDLQLSISIVSRRDDGGYPNANLFHPKAFEYTLGSYFTDRYGQEREFNGEPSWRGPTNWIPHSHLPIFSATFNFEKNSSPIEDKLNTKFMLFPISPKHFVKMVFMIDVNSRDRKGHPLFDTSPILKLRDSILDSVRPKLGDKSREQIKAVEEDYGELRLSDTFEPLNWGDKKDPEQSVPPQLGSGTMGIDFNYG